MRNSIRSTLAVALFAIASVSPVLGNAHAKQPHLVIGAGVGDGGKVLGYPLLLHADTRTDTGTVIAMVPQGTGAQLQTITLNCTHVVTGAGAAHAMYARGKANGKTFYIQTDLSSAGDRAYIIISRQGGPKFCGTPDSGVGYGYLGVLFFMNQ